MKLALVAVIAIPLIALGTLRCRLHAFLVSAGVGAPILLANMIVLEAHAPDSDFDILFFFACVAWSLALVLCYAMFFSIAAALFAWFEGGR
jgi:hypothetical protein